MKQNAITFNDYDKLVDTLLWFSSDINLRFNVQLSIKNKDGMRQSFHQEFSYNSRFFDTSLSRQIRRNIDCYLSIDIKNDFTNSIQIRYHNMIMLKLKLNNVAQWFTTLYKIKEDKLYIGGKYKNEQTVLEGGKCIEFEPIVITYDDGKCSGGVRMYINTKSVSVDIDINKFMAFYYLISTFNMYQSAITLINYLERPEYGTNNFAIGGDPRNSNSFGYDEFKNEKVDKGDGSKSFFRSI